MNWQPPTTPTPSDPPMVRVARRWWWVPVVGVVTVVALVTQFRDPADDVNPSFRSYIDTLDDCTELQDEFDRADDAGELNYIDDALRRAGCYD